MPQEVGASSRIIRLRAFLLVGGLLAQLLERVDPILDIVDHNEHRQNLELDAVRGERLAKVYGLIQHPLGRNCHQVLQGLLNGLLSSVKGLLC